jgi:ubiquinone/menaquinone biosynthesis C-methylase UbiE
MFFNPFGKEYAWAPRWNVFERLYMRIFGVVDLPSRLRARLVIRAMDKYPGKVLLDFGCGAGTYSFYLSRSSNVKVKGIDVNESRIEESKLIMKTIGRNNTEFYARNGHGSLGFFDDASFDSALAVEVFQYLPDLEGTLREMYRLLKPGGYLLGHVPVLGYLRETEHTLFDDGNIRLFLNRSGFEIIKVTSSFGGTIRQLCAFYDKIVNSKYITALLYPFLLAISHAFNVEAPDGDYRFFIARKPPEENERGGSPLEERPKGPRG